MSLPYLSLVRMKSDRFQADGIEPGAIGIILDVYGDDAYEVEFSDRDGITIALLTLPGDAIEPALECSSLVAPRSSG